MKKTKKWVGAGCVCLVALGLAACTSQPGQEPGAESSPPVIGQRPVASQSAPQANAIETPFKSPITAVSPPPSQRPGFEEPTPLYVENPEVGKYYSKFESILSEHATEVESRLDMRDERVEWVDGFEVISPHELRVYFSGGVRECFAERIAVEEGPGVVKIALVSGSVGRDQACRLPAFPYYITVKTEQDLTKAILVEAAEDDVNLR